MDCEKISLLMSDALYGELAQEEAKEFYSHLENCSSCKAEFEEFQSVINITENRVKPEREEYFWNNYWLKLEDKIEEKSEIKSFWGKISEYFNPVPKLALNITAAIVLVVLGVLIGKMDFSSEEIQPEQIKSQSNVINASLAERSDRYIQRSKVLLLGLVNYDSEDIRDINLHKQKEISQELLQEASYLKSEFKSQDAKKIKKLISDLEVILLQIANLEKENDLDGIDMIKSGVDRKGIFLKININEMQKANRLINSKNQNEEVKI